MDKFLKCLFIISFTVIYSSCIALVIEYPRQDNVNTTIVMIEDIS